MTGHARLNVRVAPRAAGSSIVGRHGSAWKVRVAAPPEDGRANAAVVRLLADALDIPPAHIAVEVGHSSRDKILSFSGVSLDELERRLEVVTGHTPVRTV